MDAAGAAKAAATSTAGNALPVAGAPPTRTLDEAAFKAPCSLGLIAGTVDEGAGFVWPGMAAVADASGEQPTYPGNCAHDGGAAPGLIKVLYPTVEVGVEASGAEAGA
jgi:hypothetical protein